MVPVNVDVTSISILAIVATLALLIVRTKSLWLLNSRMLLTAALGFVMGNATLSLVDAVRHQGPGVVVFHDDEHGRDYPEKVPQGQFKRHEIGQSGLLLIAGAMVWVAVARHGRSENKSNSEARDL